MKRSNRLMILLGVFLAIFAVVGVLVLGNGGGGGGQPKGSPTPTPEPQVQVVIAKVDINLGDKITTDMVTTETMTLSQRDALGSDTFSAPSQVAGQVAGGLIKKGDILYADKSFLPAGAFVQGQDLAPAVAAGKVAVAMEVDQVNGVGALIVPGDHVDIVLSVWVNQVHITGILGAAKVDLGGSLDVTTKMVIQNRKVLAALLPAVVPTTEQGGANTGASPTPAPKPSAATVTNSGAHMIVVVEVLPDEAEIIRWAQREEKPDVQNYITLGLALRSDKDDDAAAVTTPGITYKQMVLLYGVLPPDPRAIVPADLAKLISF